MASRQQLLDWCNQTLEVYRFKDYAPNGLQVEGSPEVNRIVTAVTASQAAIDFAATSGAQMLLVHHGMFWKNEPPVIVGWKKQRIATLFQHNINMAGYHLPLDAHPELGNNAQLGQLLNLETTYRSGEQDLINFGHPSAPQTLAQLANQIETVLQRRPTVVGNPNTAIHKAAWCTGGAQSFFQTAIDEGVNVYITGEISEPQYHLAQETGVAFISAGHHATERYGIQALGQALNNAFGVETEFFDEQNPA